jgi:proline dehydrogenase
MLNHLLFWASRQPRVKQLLLSAPPSRAVVARFVAGDLVDDAVRVARSLAAAGLLVTIDHLGEDTVDRGQAEWVTRAYQELLSRLADSDLQRSAEVSIKLSALGQGFDEELAFDQARQICAAAEGVGTTVTIDMEDHTTTDSTLRTVDRLRADFPWVGAVIQAGLRRSEADCAALASAGSRVRLCKGAYDEPDTVAFRAHREVDRSFERCLSQLTTAPSYPMVATHDPHLISFATELLEQQGRSSASYEFQMLYGVRPQEQRRLAAAGHRVRIYVPYGREWYGYLMRRLAERPANVAFFLRAVASRS